MVTQEAYDDLKRKYDDLEAKYDRMLPMINYLQRHLFGKSSERHESTPANPLQPSLFAPDAPVETVILEKEQITYERTKKAAVKHPGRKPLNTDLPREVIEVLHAQADPATMERIGEQVTEQLAMRPAQFYVKQYVYPKYRDAITGKIYQAPAVDGSFARFSVDESVAAHVVVQKLVDHLPLYRQARIFERQRVELSESTLGDLFTQVANQLAQVYEVHRQEMLASGYLNVDETTIQVLDSDKKGATKQGCYWVYYDPLKKSVLFNYDRGHGHEAAQKILSEYQGYLQTDGATVYEAYTHVPGITMVGCMAHARRKFFDAKTADKLLAEEALNLFGAVYAVEKHIREEGLTGEEKLAFRQKHAVPALAALHTWMTQQYEGLLRPSSPIRSAIEYSLKRWDKLTIYASTHLLDIDNNKVENAIRPVTIGRKNYMFAGSHEAAQRSAMLYSLLGTCKANGINPFEWLKVTLKKLHTHPVSRIKELLPHNFQAENQC